MTISEIVVNRSSVASLSASGFTKTSIGEYSLATTTPALAQAAIRLLVFDPTENQVASGSTVVTTFTISVDDGGTPQTDDSTEMTVTSINDSPMLATTADDPNFLEEGGAVGVFSTTTIDTAAIRALAGESIN